MRLAVLLACLLAAGCRDDTYELAVELTGGDPERGRLAIRHRGCASCHDVPGFEGVRSTVGPSLRGLRTRRYLAGMLPSSPANLLRWIQQPQAIVPGNVMPDMGIADPEARDIAAYLLAH